MSRRKMLQEPKLSGLLVSLALVAHGCGTPTSDKQPGSDDGASKGIDTSATVSAGQGAVLELSTGAKLVIPEDAVTTDVEVTVRRPADAQAEALLESVPADHKVASAPYVLTPHGTQFAQDVEITLPVAAGSDATKLVVAWLKDEQDTSWVTLGRPEVANGKATMKLRHFSVVVLLETEESTEDGEEHVLDPGTSDTLKLTSLSVTSHPRDAAGKLTIELTGEGFVEDLMLLVDGHSERWVLVTSPTTATVTVWELLTTAGKHGLSVGISGENAQGEYGFYERSNELLFTVTGTNPVPTPEEIDPSLLALHWGSESRIKGSGFTSRAVITATQGSTTHVLRTDLDNPNQLEVEYPQVMMDTEGKWTLTVTNPPPGGGSAIVPGGVEFSADVSPSAFIWQVTPSVVFSNAGPQEVVLEGYGYTSATTASASLNGGVPQALSIVSFDRTVLTLSVPAELLIENGDLTVEVTNPAPGGGSGSIEISVVSPLKPIKLISVTPSVIAANTNTLLTLVGENFPVDDDPLTYSHVVLHSPDGTQQHLGDTQFQTTPTEWRPAVLSFWIPDAGTYQLSVKASIDGNDGSVESNRLDLVVQ